MPEKLPNQDPQYYERLAAWEELDREINRQSRAAYGEDIEPAINDVVMGLNAILGGWYTKMSCEGHDDGMNPYPWVGFNTADEAQLEGLTSLLAEFNGQREDDPSIRLGIYTDFGGISSGTLSLTTPLGIGLRSGKSRYPEEADELLEAQQVEMNDFAAFLKEKFLSGTVLEARVEEDEDDYEYGNDGKPEDDFDDVPLK